MAVYANTTLGDITIDQIWDQDVLAGRYSTSVILNRVLNKSQVVKKHGYLVVIPIEPTYSAGTVTGTDGSFTPSNTAPTVANINLNVWQYHAVTVTDQAQLQSFWDPAGSTFGKIAGKVLGVAVEQNLRDLFASLTGLGTVGTTDPGQSTAFSKEAVQAALLLAEDNKIPRESLSFILCPSAFYGGLFTDPDMTRADATGLPKSVHTTGFRTPLYGVPAYASTELSKTGAGDNSRIGALIHKEALACAFQADNKYGKESQIGAGKLATTVVAASLYGSVVARSDHGVRLYIKA